MLGMSPSTETMNVSLEKNGVEVPDSARIGDDGIPRDRWGRPYIWHRGNFEVYSRPSSLHSKVEDATSLMDWKRDCGIIAGVRYIQAMGTRDDSLSDLVDYNGLSLESPGSLESVRRARVFSPDSDASDFGTQVHYWIEQAYRCQEPMLFLLSSLMEQTEELDCKACQLAIDIWVALTANWEIKGCEVRMVNDKLKMAGTADLILKFAGDPDDPRYAKLPPEVLLGSENIIGDVKTGTLQYLSWALQLSVYANSQGYDYETMRRTRLNINKDCVMVVHVPAKTAIHEEGAYTEYFLDVSEVPKKVTKLLRALDDFKKPATQFKAWKVKSSLQ